MGAAAERGHSGATSKSDGTDARWPRRKAVEAARGTARKPPQRVDGGGLFLFTLFGGRGYGPHSRCWKEEQSEAFRNALYRRDCAIFSDENTQFAGACALLLVDLWPVDNVAADGRG